MSNCYKSDLNVVRERKENPTRYVVVVGLVDENQRILLIRSTRLPNQWQPVGGGIEPGDATPIDALVREVSEETSLGLTADDLEYEITADYDFGCGKVYCYSARIDSDEPVSFSRREVVEHRWFSLEEALQVDSFPATKRGSSPQKLYHLRLCLL